MVRYSDYVEAWRTISSMWVTLPTQDGEDLKVDEVDLTLFPSLVYMEYYLPRVRGCTMEDFCENWCGKVTTRYQQLCRQSTFREYRDELTRELEGSERVQEGVRRIREDIKRNGGWRIPERKVGGYEEAFGS